MVGNQLEYNKELTLASVACAVAERAPNQLYRIISRRALLTQSGRLFLPRAIAFTLLAHL
jgi:hypothetical protein